MSMFIGRRRFVQKTREVLNVSYQTSKRHTIYCTQEFLDLRLLREKGFAVFQETNFKTRLADAILVLDGLGSIIR